MQKYYILIFKSVSCQFHISLMDNVKLSLGDSGDNHHKPCSPSQLCGALFHLSAVFNEKAIINALCATFRETNGRQRLQLWSLTSNQPKTDIK